MLSNARAFDMTSMQHALPSTIGITISQIDSIISSEIRALDSLGDSCSFAFTNKEVQRINDLTNAEETTDDPSDMELRYIEYLKRDIKQCINQKLELYAIYLSNLDRVRCDIIGVQLLNIDSLLDESTGTDVDILKQFKQHLIGISDNYREKRLQFEAARIAVISFYETIL